jgi:hypothetical protein
VVSGLSRYGEWINALRESFYRDTLWLNDLGVLLMPLPAHYEAALVEGTTFQGKTWTL